MCFTLRCKHILATAFVEEYINTLENIVIASCCCDLHIFFGIGFVSLTLRQWFCAKCLWYVRTLDAVQQPRSSSSWSGRPAAFQVPLSPAAPVGTGCSRRYVRGSQRLLRWQWHTRTTSLIDHLTTWAKYDMAINTNKTKAATTCKDTCDILLTIRNHNRRIHFINWEH